MGCNSDYLNATSYEREISRVACLLGELDGKSFSKAEWHGYHPDVYGKTSREVGDRMTRDLCARLKTVDVSRYSLEMQTWWRDHQAADRDRQAREAADRENAELRRRALAKLTPAEIAALGW